MKGNGLKYCFVIKCAKTANLGLGDSAWRLSTRVLIPVRLRLRDETPDTWDNEDQYCDHDHHAIFHDHSWSSTAARLFKIQNSNCWSSEPFWTCRRGDGSAWEGGKSYGRRDRLGAWGYQDIRLRGRDEVGVGWQYSSCGQCETSKSWHCDPAWCSCTCRRASLDSDF